MRQRFLNMLALVGFFSFAGCAAEDVLSDDPSGDDDLITFNAVQEGAATKAEISQSDSKVINWSAGDAITVYDGEGNSVRFGLTEGAGSTRASFSGKISQTAESYLALSPYQGGTFSDDGKIEFVEMKSKQAAVAGSFDPEAALMVSRTEPGGTSMSFRNVVGYVKVTPQFDCDMISLISEDSSDLLAGTVSIDYNNGEPVVTVSDDGTNSVSISGDIVAGKTYYIAVLPGTLKSGFRLVFFAKDGKDAIKSTSKPLEVKRNTVINFGSVNSTALAQIPYVTFTADAEQIFKMSLGDGITSLQYSVNNAPWQDIVSNKEIVFGGSDGSLRLRGMSALGTKRGESLEENNIFYSSIMFTKKNILVDCSGDIRTLVDYSNYEKAKTNQARFAFLFCKCTNLTSAPELPATMLAECCYTGMFAGCTGLTSAPELPATMLAYDCYGGMFSGCTGLTSAPELLAMTLAHSCYYGMFSGCTGLTSAPELPATTLAGYCYGGMFSGCTGLTSAPELPATKLAFSCYDGMFSGCTGLASAPELPATTLARSCYESMFAGCTGLTSAPELPATTLNNYCYYGMFSGCTNLRLARIRALTIGNFYDPLTNWLDKCAAKGIIRKPSALTLPSSVVPSGWSVVDYD